MHPDGLCQASCERGRGSGEFLPLLPPPNQPSSENMPILWGPGSGTGALWNPHPHPWHSLQRTPRSRAGPQLRRLYRTLKKEQRTAEEKADGSHWRQRPIQPTGDRLVPKWRRQISVSAHPILSQGWGVSMRARGPALPSPVSCQGHRNRGPCPSTSSQHRAP